jgi:hypothetical protein
MTAASLFNQLKAGKISQEQFLYEVRRDQNLPFISPITTFKEAIKILQNRGIVTEVFEMGPAEGAEKCSCGGNYESHEDAGEMVCASCGERKTLSEDPEDKEEYDPFYDREEEINYGIDDEDRETGDDMEGNREEDYVGEDEGYGDDELEDIIAKQDAEKQGQEDVLAQWDLEEDRDEDTAPDDIYTPGEEDEDTPPEDRMSLREMVQDFVKNAMKGGSSMDEAKEAAREYFNKKESLNEAAKPKLTVDQVNPYEFKKGVNIEMGTDKTPAPDWNANMSDMAANIQKAQAKVLKNLAKDPAYYTNMIAGKHKEKKAPVVKADGYVKAPKSKMEKSNVKTTLSKTEKAKGNPQGVKVMKEGIEDQWKPGTQFKNLKNNQITTVKKFDDLGNVIVTTDAMPGKEWTWPAEELSNMIKKGELELTKVQKEGSAYSKIKEYVTKQLKKEAQLVKSATTGATIDVLPDAQAQKAKAELQKKGVKATSVAV